MPRVYKVLRIGVLSVAALGAAIVGFTELRSRPSRDVEHRLRVTPAVGFAEVYEETNQIPYHFTIHNDGDRVVTVDSVRTSCSCAVASFESQTISPHGSIDISVVYNVAGKFGELPSRSVVITPSGDAKPLMCELSGLRHRRFQVTPQTASFGDVRQGAKEDVEVRVLAVGPEMKLVPQKTMTNLPHLGIKIIAHDKLDAQDSVVLRLNLAEDAPIGPFNGTVFVPRAEDDGIGAMFYVKGKVIGVLEASPRKVLFGVTSGSKLRKRIVRVVRSDSDFPEAATVVGVSELPRGISVDILEEDDGVELTLNPKEFSIGVHDGTFVLVGELNGTRYNLTIPYAAIIR